MPNYQNRVSPPNLENATYNFAQIAFARRCSWGVASWFTEKFWQKCWQRVAALQPQ